MGPLILVGFSLGGNVALKLAGELGETELLNSVCAVSTPIDLAACVRQLDRPSNRLYAQRFLRPIEREIRRKALHVPHLYSAEGIDSIKGIWEFDDRYTGPLFGFGNAETYYRTHRPSAFWTIRIPALLIQAKDDPIIPFETYEQRAFEKNPWLQLLAVEHGGHLGFISRRRPRFWLDGVALSWIERQAGSASGCSASTLREQTTG